MRRERTDFLRAAYDVMSRPSFSYLTDVRDWAECVRFLSESVPVCVLRADPPDDEMVAFAVHGYFAANYDGCGDGPLMRTLDRELRKRLAAA